MQPSSLNFFCPGFSRGSLQLAAVIIEFLLPWILKRFYPGYDSRKMAMSILGSPSSPVSSLYSAWLVVLGLILSLASSVYFSVLSERTVLAVLTSGSIFLFALGAGILAGIFKADGLCHPEYMVIHLP